MATYHLVEGPKDGLNLPAPEHPHRTVNVLDVGVRDDGQEAISWHHVYEREGDGDYHFRETIETVVSA